MGNVYIAEFINQLIHCLTRMRTRFNEEDDIILTAQSKLNAVPSLQIEKCIVISVKYLSIQMTMEELFDNGSLKQENRI